MCSTICITNPEARKTETNPVAEQETEQSRKQSKKQKQKTEQETEKTETEQESRAKSRARKRRQRVEAKTHLLNTCPAHLLHVKILIPLIQP
jgi:hypothetical protein